MPARRPLFPYIIYYDKDFFCHSHSVVENLTSVFPLYPPLHFLHAAETLGKHTQKHCSQKISFACNLIFFSL